MGLSGGAGEDPGPEPGKEGPGPWPSRRQIGMAAALATGVTLLLYAASLHAGLHGEDYIWLYEARDTQDLQMLFQARSWPFVRPVCAGYFWLLWHLFGLGAVGWHACSLVLHATAAVIVYALLRRLAVGHGAGIVAMLCYVAWPPSWEAVCWLSAVGELLKGLLMGATLLAFVSWRISPGRWGGVATIGLSLLALMAKESGVVLPVLLILADLLLAPRPPLPRVLFRGAGFLALAGAVYLAERALVTAGGASSSFYDVHSVFSGSFASGLLGMVIDGSGLGSVIRTPSGAGAVACWAGMLAVAGVGARRAPRAVFFGLMVPIVYVPVALVAPEFIAYDRYGYCASLAFAALLGLALSAMRRKWARPFGMVAGAAAVVWMGASLRQHVVSVSQGMAARQVDAGAVREGLARLSRDGTAYVFAPPPEQHSNGYAVALLADLPARQVRDWYDVTRHQSLPEGDVMLYYDERSAAFTDLTDPVQTILTLRERRVDDARGQAKTAVGPGRVVRSWIMGDPIDREMWKRVGIENSEGTATYHTRGYPGHLYAPDLSLDPMQVGSVQIEARVHGQAGPEATMLLAWTSNIEGGFGPDRTQEVRLPREAEGWRTLTLYPCNRPSWWLEPRIEGLFLVPSTTPTSVEIRSIRLVEPGRRPRAPGG